MGVYRKQIEIVGDILYAAEELTIDNNCASITKLIQKANISHNRISKILSNLVSQGLLEQVNSNRACKYRISMTGKDFLKAYRTFSEFTDNFGLRI
jgi:predicted transcriptional regulator